MLPTEIVRSVHVPCALSWDAEIFLKAPPRLASIISSFQIKKCSDSEADKDGSQCVYANFVQMWPPRGIQADIRTVGKDHEAVDCVGSLSPPGESFTTICLTIEDLLFYSTLANSYWP